MPRQSLKNAALYAAALEGLELQRTRLDEQIKQVRAMLGKGGSKPAAEAGAAAPAKRRRKRRKLSAAARARIAAAQKKRWAEFRKKTGG